MQTIVWLRHLLCSLPFIVCSRIHLKFYVALPVSKHKLLAQMCVLSLQLLHLQRRTPGPETKPGKAGILEYSLSNLPRGEPRRSRSPVVTVGGTQTLTLMVTPMFSHILVICHQSSLSLPTSRWNCRICFLFSLLSLLPLLTPTLFSI